MELKIEDIITRYKQENANLTERMILAEATVEAMQRENQNLQLANQALMNPVEKENEA